MKAQRRHELQENVLAHELGQMRIFFNRYGNLITGIVVVAMVVLLVVWHYRSKRSAELSEQAAMYETLKQDMYVPAKQTSSLEAMIDLAENARDPLLSASASMFAADFCTNQYIKDRSGEQGEYREKAKKYYNMVIKDHSGRENFVAKAHLGLGMLAESEADWTTAKSKYERVRRLLDDTYPASAEAKRRLDNLGVWSEHFRFATSAPTTAPTTLPADTQPASGPARTNEGK